LLSFSFNPRISCLLLSSASGAFLPFLARLPMPLMSLGSLYTGTRIISTTHNAAAFPSIRLKCSISRNQIRTYSSEHLCGLEVSCGPPTFAPRYTTCGCLSGTCHARRVFFPSLWACWSSDAESSFSYMRNMRTVKVTYWDRIFFCKCLYVFGVTRCLGNPSGGVCWRLEHVWNRRRRQVGWARLRVRVPV
jgi:hypothetical protein